MGAAFQGPIPALADAAPADGHGVGRLQFLYPGEYAAAAGTGRADAQYLAPSGGVHPGRKAGIPEESLELGAKDQRAVVGQGVKERLYTEAVPAGEELVSDSVPDHKGVDALQPAGTSSPQAI